MDIGSEGLGLSLFGDVEGQGGSSGADADYVARLIDSELGLLQSIAETPLSQQYEHGDKSELIDATASFLGVGPSDRMPELEYLISRALKADASSPTSVKQWIAKQLDVMTRDSRSPSSGSRLTDLVMYLKAIDEHIRQRGSPKQDRVF